MSDLKSKLPDLKDITSISSKLFKDLKKSVTEIIGDYKKKHFKDEVKESKKTAATEAAPKKTAAKKATPKKETTSKTTKK